MQNLLQSLSSFLNRFRKPVRSVNKYLIYSGANLKSGLSAQQIKDDIIARQIELGIPTGNINGNIPNLQEDMYFVIADVIIKHLIENAKIEVAIEPNIPIIGEGANAGGPVIINGRTINIAKGIGIIH